MSSKVCAPVPTSASGDLGYIECKYGKMKREYSKPLARADIGQVVASLHDSFVTAPVEGSRLQTMLGCIFLVNTPFSHILAMSTMCSLESAFQGSVAQTTA